MKNLALFSLGLVGLLTTSCKKSGYDIEDFVLKDAQIRSIKLSAANNPYLKETFFSIDQNKGIIYNAVPLPFQSKVDSVQIELDKRQDAKYEYFNTKSNDWSPLTSLDTFNLAQTPLKIRIALTVFGSEKKDYILKCNVYSKDPNTFEWQAVKEIANPNFSTLKKVIVFGQNTANIKIFTLGESIKAYTVKNGVFEAVPLSGLPENVSKINHGFEVVGQNTYMLCPNEGAPYISKDGSTWTKASTSENITALSLINNPEKKNELILCGLTQKNGKKFFCTQPINGGKLNLYEEVPEGFPTQNIRLTSYIKNNTTSIRLYGNQPSSPIHSFYWETSNGHDWMNFQPQELGLAKTVTIDSPFTFTTKSGVSYIYNNENSGVSTFFSVRNDHLWRQGDSKGMYPENLQKIYSLWMDEADNLWLAGQSKQGKTILWKGVRITKIN